MGLADPRAVRGREVIRLGSPLSTLGFVVVACSMLAACGSTRVVERSLDGGEPLTQASAAEDRRVHMDLIRRMIDQNQNYAALAHIEAQQRSRNSDELRLLEADVRRKLNQTATAQQIYQSLLSGPYAAQAHHGMGLIWAQSDPVQSLSHLRRAVQLAPTDVELRNDLGYSLMLARRYPDALPEMATAVELDPSSDKARNNLLILMILMRDERSVQRIVRESNIDSATLAKLRRQAEILVSTPRPAPTPVTKPSRAG